MAKPITKGPVVSYRLPLSVHAKAVERAEAKGLSVGQWVAAQITRALAE